MNNNQHHFHEVLVHLIGSMRVKQDLLNNFNICSKILVNVMLLTFLKDPPPIVSVSKLVRARILD